MSHAFLESRYIFCGNPPSRALPKWPLKQYKKNIPPLHLTWQPFKDRRAFVFLEGKLMSVCVCVCGKSNGNEHNNQTFSHFRPLSFSPLPSPGHVVELSQQAIFIANFFFFSVDTQARIRVHWVVEWNTFFSPFRCFRRAFSGSLSVAGHWPPLHAVVTYFRLHEWIKTTHSLCLNVLWNHITA